MSRLLAMCLALGCATASAQELSISLIERGANGATVVATVTVPMASDESARAASSVMRMWISNSSGIAAATIIPVGADGRPLGEAAANAAPQ